MNIFEFAADSPILAFCIVYMITRTIFLIINRICRSLNIRKNGWPPPHCDADGDFPKPATTEGEG